VTRLEIGGMVFIIGGIVLLLFFRSG